MKNCFFVFLTILLFIGSAKAESWVTPEDIEELLSKNPELYRAVNLKVITQNSGIQSLEFKSQKSVAVINPAGGGGFVACEMTYEYHLYNGKTGTLTANQSCETE